MEERFFASFIHCFFIAFGVIVGGTVIGKCRLIFYWRCTAYCHEPNCTVFENLGDCLCYWRYL